MIIPMETLKNISFAVKDASAVRRKPEFTQLNNKGRSCNGFIYVINGSCEFSFNGESFTMSAGAVAYIPLGSVHIFTILSDDFEMYRINFDIFAEGEAVFFSSHPVLVTDNAPTEFRESAEEMSKGSPEKNYLCETKFVCKLLCSLTEHNINKRSRIAPAVEYIQRNLSDSPDVDKLAGMCFLGRSRFYTLFSDEIGCSPLEYRAALIIRKANILLSSGDVTVFEAAHLLGFDDAAYFSRFYKKHTGFSPSKFLKK